MALVLSLPFVVEGQESMIELATGSEDAKFQASLNELSETVKQVSSSGEMSQRTFELQVPSNIESVKTQQQALIYTQERGGQSKNFSVSFDTEINASSLSAERGLQELKVTYIDGKAVIEPSTPPGQDFSISVKSYSQPVPENGIFNSTVEVINRGENQASQDIVFQIDAGNLHEETRPDEALDSGESREYSFDWDTTSQSPGTYDFTALTQNDTVNREFEIADSGTAVFDVSNIQASPDPVTEGENVTVTADVENTGDGDGTQEIRLLINGSEEDSDSPILNQGESKQVEFNYTTSSSDRPVIEASVATDDTSESTYVQVEDASEFTEQGLLVHLDAESIEGLSEGESVERWNDSTANEFDATSPSVSESPALSSSGINGVQSVEFDGSSSVLTISHSSEMDMDNFQIFTVFKASSSDLTNEIGVIHNKQTSNTFNDRNWWLALDNGQGFAGGNGALGLRTSSGGEVVSLNADGKNYIDDNTYLVSAKVNSTEDEAELRINSSLKASASNVGIPEGEGAPIGIGAEISGSTSSGFSRYFGGQIGEIMIYNETLSTTQEQELENYLSNKWGITLS